MLFHYANDDVNQWWGVFIVRKTKRIAKFNGLEPRRCEDTKEIVAPAIDPKSFGTFEKQAPGPLFENGANM